MPSITPTEFPFLAPAAKKFVGEVKGEFGVPVVLIGTGAEVYSIIDRRKN